MEPHGITDSGVFAMGELIGYARVSTEDQNLDLQVDALRAHGVKDHFLFTEKASGAKAKRTELEAALRMLRPEDTLVVYRLDRLGRSLKELTTIVDSLAERQVEFVSLTEHIDTSSAGGRLIFNVFGAVAQFERDLISERTKAGLRAARARGRKGGRAPKLNAGQAKEAAQLLEDNPTLTYARVASMFNVGRATLYRTFQRHGIEVRDDFPALTGLRDKK